VGDVSDSSKPQDPSSPDQSIRSSIRQTSARPRLTHPRSNRLSGQGVFKAILDANLRSWQGPIGMAIKPCDAPRSRMGISIGRPVGNAARRNRIKRLLREAFRAMQHDWPRNYDVVILVKPHAPLALADYASILRNLRHKLHARSTSTSGSP
jgi:ribonuclease P protein component